MATIDTYRAAFKNHRSTAAHSGATKSQWDSALSEAWGDLTNDGERFADGGSAIDKARIWADAAELAMERLTGC